MGFIVNACGIEANPDKIQALIDMPSPRKHKDIQSLTGRMAALSRFISKSTDRCLPFFNLLRGGKKFEWTEECELAFQELKKHLAEPPILSKPETGEVLFLYLSTTEHAISAVLVREEERVQRPVYYISKRLLGAESRYPLMEKLALSLIHSFRKLRPYFQAHPIHVLTDQPLRQVLSKPEASGRLLKWAVELGQFEITYHPRMTIKAQALADFIVECTGIADDEVITTAHELWKLYVDGSSNENGAGAGIILVTRAVSRFHSALRFGFKASNNEALLAGLRIAKELKAKAIHCYSDSQLVVN